MALKEEEPKTSAAGFLVDFKYGGNNRLLHRTRIFHWTIPGTSANSQKIVIIFIFSCYSYCPCEFAMCDVVFVIFVIFVR